MRAKWIKPWVVIAIVAALILSFGLWLSLHSQTRLRAEDIQSYVDRLDGSGNPENLEFIREQAYNLATMLFEEPARQEEFAKELSEMYWEAKDKDVLLVYNTGGFGGTSLIVDPQWQSILDGIQSWLANSGYTSMIVEHKRGEHELSGWIGELKGLLSSYPARAPELAAKIAFLTKYDHDLRIIITGRSNGAVFSNEVMKLLEFDTRVCSVQAGRLFWYDEPAPGRSLVMDNNGVTPDAKARGDLWAIVRANLGRIPTTSEPEGGSMKIINWYIKIPGHEYNWDYPEIRAQIEAFLQENFQEA